MEGWICLYRKIMECKIWESNEKFDKRSAWISLLLKANHKDTTVLIGNSVMEIKKGSFITSEVKLAEEWKWNRKTVRAFLKMLENDKMIVKKSTTKYTIISIVNWDMYQIQEHQDTQQSIQQSTQQSNIKMDTDNNINNNINNNEQKQILLEHFNLIWEKYPNKKGKAKAIEYYLQWIKGRSIAGITRKLTDEQMYYAVVKYQKECEKNNVEQQFIKHGDTFFNKAILDYVEGEDE